MRNRKNQNTQSRSSHQDVHRLLKLHNELKKEFGKHDNLLSQITYPYSAITTALLQAFLVLSVYNPLLEKFKVQKLANTRALEERSLQMRTGLTYEDAYNFFTEPLHNPYAPEEVKAKARMFIQLAESKLMDHLAVAAKCIGANPKDLLSRLASINGVHIHRILTTTEQECLNTGFIHYLLPYIQNLQEDEMTSYANIAIGVLGFAMMPAAVMFTKSLYSNYILGLKNLTIQKDAVANMSIEQGESFLEQLIRYNSHLEKLARRNIKYARIASAFILVSYTFLMMLTDTLSDNPYASSLNLTMFLMAYAALTNFAKDITSSVRNVLKKNKIDRNRKLLEDTLQDIADVDLYAIRDNNYAEFVISPKKLSKNKAINNMLKQAFIKQEIKIKYSYRDIVLPANINITFGKLNAVKQHFIKAMDLSENAKESKCALHKLSKCLNRTHGTYIFNGRDSSSKAVMEYYLHVPDRFNALISIERLNAIFPNASMITNNGNNFHLSFDNIDEKINPESLKNLMNDIENHRTLSTKSGFIDDATEEEKRAPHKTKSHTDDKKNAEKEEIRTESEITAKPHAKIITWASAVYNPDDPACRVYPLIIPEKCGLPKDTFYIYMALTPNDFKKYPGAFDVFNNLVIKGKFARSNLGEDGLKLTREIARDTKGNQFVAAGKLKALGVFSDMRCHAGDERSADDKVLFIIKGINPHAH